MEASKPAEENALPVYQKFEIADLGVLYLRKSNLASKWNLPEAAIAMPTINAKINLPPIIIPSSGRSKTALLDLSDAMEGKEDYIEIVVVREDEKDEYLSTTLHHDAIDVFVMKSLGHNTIGEARMVSKKLGQYITKEAAGRNFMFLLDDNILFWNGVTLINDPCSLFKLESNSKTSQRSDISLYQMLSHFSRNNFQEVKDFNILGFSIGAHKSITRRKLAYGRKHVAAAVLINIQKSTGIDYNPKAWAMEDIDFNMRTDQLSSRNTNEGVIVKCLRFVAFKKKLRGGGVVPCDVPEDVVQLMRQAPDWTGVEVRKKERCTLTLSEAQTRIQPGISGTSGVGRGGQKRGNAVGRGRGRGGGKEGEQGRRRGAGPKGRGRGGEQPRGGGQGRRDGQEGGQRGEQGGARGRGRGVEREGGGGGGKTVGGEKRIGRGGGRRGGQGGGIGAGARGGRVNGQQGEGNGNEGGGEAGEHGQVGGGTGGIENRGRGGQGRGRGTGQKSKISEILMGGKAPQVKTEDTDVGSQKSFDITKFKILLSEARQIPADEKRLEEDERELKAREEKLHEEMRKLDADKRSLGEARKALAMRKRKYDEMEQEAFANQDATFNGGLVSRRQRPN